MNEDRRETSRVVHSMNVTAFLSLKAEMSAPKGTIIVTGANGGLGSAIVSRIIQTSALAEHFQGVYTVRIAAKAEVLQSQLRKAPTTHKHDIIELDLSRLASVRDVAAAINKRVADGSLPPIRALILNAAYQDWTAIVRPRHV
jgi:NAD(P)-dependent dehydrogenase (short-subunit alcohol dehydrogenase family)